MNIKHTLWALKILYYKLYGIVQFSTQISSSLFFFFFQDFYKTTGNPDTPHSLKSILLIISSMRSYLSSNLQHLAQKLSYSRCLIYACYSKKNLLPIDIKLKKYWKLLDSRNIRMVQTKFLFSTVNTILQNHSAQCIFPAIFQVSFD